MYHKEKVNVSNIRTIVAYTPESANKLLEICKFEKEELKLIHT